MWGESFNFFFIFWDYIFQFGKYSFWRKLERIDLEPSVFHYIPFNKQSKFLRKTKSGIILFVECKMTKLYFSLLFDNPFCTLSCWFWKKIFHQPTEFYLNKIKDERWLWQVVEKFFFSKFNGINFQTKKNQHKFLWNSRTISSFNYGFFFVKKLDV